MPLIVTKNTFSAPLGNHPAICIGVIELGTVFDTMHNRERHEVLFEWALPHQKSSEDDRCATISKFYAMSLAEASALYQHLVSWRGRAFTQEELNGFDLFTFLGVPCLLNVVPHNKQNGAVSTKVGTIAPLPRGMEVPTTTMPLRKFCFAEATPADYEMLSDGLKRRLAKANEFPAFKKRLEQQGYTFPALDDAKALPTGPVALAATAAPMATANDLPF